MKIVISDKEQSVLIDIRGMPERVYSMVYAFQQENGKNVLEGDDDDFDELLRLISEEIGEGLCPKKNIPILLGVCKKIDPESLNWIGQ